MTFQEFEDRLDVLLLEAGPGETREDIFRRLPDELRAKAAKCEQSRQLLSDWIWLHEQISQLPVPHPSKEFSDHVVLQLAQPSATGELEDPLANTDSPSPWRTARSLGLALVGLAASIAIGVMLLPRPDPIAAPTVATNTSEPVDLRDHLRDTGTAYLALAQVMADAVRLADVEPTERQSAPEPTETKTGTELASARANPPALHEAIRGSTETFVDAGRDIGTTIRPITDSAVGAFSFLLPSKPSQLEEKPSI